MERLPKSVLRYMQEINLNHYSPGFLKMTPEGNLLEHGGDVERYGLTALSPGTPVEETAFYLESFFPLQTPGIILPGMETKEGVLADIHVFLEKKKYVWVLFLDISEEEQKLRSILQRSNELRLIEEKYNKLLHSQISGQIFNRLEIAVLKRSGENRFAVLGALPDWFHRLFDDTPGLNHHLDPVKYFPFLEFFLGEEAPQLWEKRTDEKVFSDLWIESDKEGREYYLEAVAFSLEDEKILLIKTINSESSRNYYHIQKGREKSLAYEQVLKSEKILRTSERNLLAAKKMAEDANRAKSRFLANISHELRTPMNAIIGISKMINRYYHENLTDKQFEGLKLISDSGERLLHLINDLLDLSKIEAGKMDVIFEPVGLEELITGVEKMISSLIKEKAIGFRVKKNVAVPHRVVTDGGKLRQVLINLLGNAVKFTEEGEIVLNIYPCNNYLYFEVTDTGIGISEKHLANIFDSFTQVNGSMAREYGGTGLGLALCKKLVTLMKGKITVTSKEGEGSTFSFCIPIKEDDKEVPEREPAGEVLPKAGPARKARKKAPRILVAEDDEVGIAVIKMMLDKHYELILAENGREAVEKFFEFKPDIVLMDIVMPEMNGYKAFDEIRSREKGKKVPIAAMTALALVEEQAEILSYGFDAYVSKPVDDEELVQTIENLLNNKGENDD